MKDPLKIAMELAARCRQFIEEPPPPRLRHLERENFKELVAMLDDIPDILENENMRQFERNLKHPFQQKKPIAGRAMGNIHALGWA